MVNFNYLLYATDVINFQVKGLKMKLFPTLFAMLASLSLTAAEQNISIQLLHNPKSFDIEKQIAINAFERCYSLLCPAKDLKLSETYLKLGDNAKKQWLTETFDEEADDVINKEHVFVMQASDEKGTIVGWLSFEYVDEAKTKIYFRQFAVTVDAQRQGIGSAILKTIIEKHPNVTQLGVVARPQNKQACSFYLKNGFEYDASYLHSGYSPEKYVGIVKNFPASK